MSTTPAVPQRLLPIPSTLGVTAIFAALALFGLAGCSGGGAVPSSPASAPAAQAPDPDTGAGEDAGDEAEKEDAEAEKEGAGKGGRGGGGKGKEGIQPYDEVVTDEAQTDEGIFTVHRIDDRVLYEIPEEELGTEFLMVSRISRTAEGLGHGGQKLGSRVVRWDRQGDRVLLREVRYDIVADPDLPIARAVADSNTAAVLAAFPIKALGGAPEQDDAAEENPGEAGSDASDTGADDGARETTDVAADDDGEGEDGEGDDGGDGDDGDGDDEVEGTDPVIDVTELFTKDSIEFGARTRIGAAGFAADRAYVERVTAFPENIEVRASHTYTKPEERNRRGNQPTSRFRPEMRPGSATLEMAYSMVKLPEDPMMPRLHDPRVGYFSVSQIDYGRDEHRAEQRRYITRWRLEKRDPTAELSEPVEPIVYWVDPATPEKWIPYVRQGIEDWQPAFEAAGFRNAIVAREAPSKEEDPDWSPEDSRYSVVRWLASEIENASGPHVHDPRTGEILESDIQYYHNIQNLLRSWYFVQVGPADPRVHRLPMPDDLMGEMLRYVVAHEVGHTLGFPHNMKASSTYPFDRLRDPEYLAEWGHTPTLMDYSRFNYLVQPGDGVPPADLFPKVGPYDKWATRWGYAPIDGAQTPDDEKATLDAWALEQDEKPWLRFSTDGSFGVDPGELTEAVGDADAVAATELGIANIRRVLDLLLPATEEPGADWDDLDELYGRTMGQWTREMNHVASIVGGMDTRQVHSGQEGYRFEPIPRQRQVEAQRFLQEQAFETPDYFVRQDILRRIEPAGITGRLRSAQASILRNLTRPDRLTRMVEVEAVSPDDAYGAVEFLDDLRQGVFSELDGRPEVDAFRRGLQQAYVEVVGQRIASLDEGGDPRAFLRGQLVELDGELERALRRTRDTATEHHFRDLRDQIDRTLDPRFAPAAPSSPFGLAEEGADGWVDPFDPTADLGCWIDPDAFVSGPGG